MNIRIRFCCENKAYVLRLAISKISGSADIRASVSYNLMWKKSVFSRGGDDAKADNNETAITERR